MEVQLAYAIGVAEPVSVMADTFGTGTIPDSQITELIRAFFKLTPKGIIETLDLRRPIYRPTAAYGHFGRTGPGFTWERTDKADASARKPCAAAPLRFEVSSAGVSPAPSVFGSSGSGRLLFLLRRVSLPLNDLGAGSAFLEPGRRCDLSNPRRRRFCLGFSLRPAVTRHSRGASAVKKVLQISRVPKT